MCCNSDVLENLENKTELIELIFCSLNTNDSETLVQIMRILQTFTWSIKKNSNSIWLTKLKDCEFLGESLIFFLNSSTKGNYKLNYIQVNILAENCMKLIIFRRSINCGLGLCWLNCAIRI